MKASDRLSLAAATVAAIAMLARSIDTARRATPTVLVEETARPASVVWGIDRGGLTEPGWLEAVRPLAAEPLFVPVLLLALSEGGDRPTEVQAYLESLSEHGSPLERGLAAFALTGRDAVR